MQKSTTSIISHRKDADGISCAALTKYLSGEDANVFLADYADMNETLSMVGPSDQVYISDLGLNKNTFPEFASQVRRLREKGEIHYTDHHPLDPDYATQLEELGVDLCHSTKECASILFFERHAEDLNSPQMKILACAAAITDYMDSQSYAKKLIASFDRQFLLYESTVLSFTIATIGRGSSESSVALLKLVDELAKGKLPHEVKNASTFAQDYASRSAELIEKVRLEGKRMANFAYFLTSESATGNVANFLIGAFNTQVGAAIRKEEPGYLEISLRSTEESKHDLGKIAGRIAVRLNTSGGGHPRASGARIRENQLNEFLQMLDEELSKPAA